MKKKILILVLIIMISFGIGISIRTAKTHIENKKIEEQYTIFEGIIQNISNGRITILPDEGKIRNGYDFIHFEIPENSENTWKIGDIVKVKFLHGHISENGAIENPILEYLGKRRLFNNIANIPVSNSESFSSTYVFKSFFSYNTNLNLEQFIEKDDFLFKKITSYEEYLEFQKLIPEIRTLTEDDFVNYYLVILLSNSTENIYTLESREENENSLTLNILKHKSISKPSTNTEPIHSGLSIVIPNRCDFDIEKINLITISTSK